MGTGKEGNIVGNTQGEGIRDSVGDEEVLVHKDNKQNGAWGSPWGTSVVVYMVTLSRWPGV